MLMLGNLLRESGVVKSLNEAAHNEIANIATIFLGIIIGSTGQLGSVVAGGMLLALMSGIIWRK
jgi:oxaloacetate decarboxylase beta subunit